MYNPDLHHRRSIRVAGYDYAQPGSYYITIVVQDRTPLFGTIDAGGLQLNDAGRMVDRWWHELATHFANVEIDAHIVMPNHLHGVLTLVDQGGHIGPPLPRIVAWFKTMSTNEFLRGIKGRDWTPFEKRLWQRGYYDHIVRDDEDLARIREYIAMNPVNWATDQDNPANPIAPNS